MIIRAGPIIATIETVLRTRLRNVRSRIIERLLKRIVMIVERFGKR